MAADLQRLVPDKAVDTKLRDPVKLDEELFALLVDEGVGVDSESLHHAV